MKPVVFRCYSQRTHSELLTVKIVCGIELYTVFFVSSLCIMAMKKDKCYFNFINNAAISIFNDNFTTKSLLSHVVQKG